MAKPYPSPPNSLCMTVPSTPDLSVNSTSSDSTSEGALGPIERNSEGQFECIFADCDKTFTRKGDCTRHFHTEHSNKPPMWRCGCCLMKKKKGIYSSSRRDHLFQHFRKFHSSSGHKTDVVRVDEFNYMFARDGCKEQFERFQADRNLDSSNHICGDEGDKSCSSSLKRSSSSSSSSSGGLTSPKRFKTFPTTGEEFDTFIEPHPEDRTLALHSGSLSVTRWSPDSTITGTTSEGFRSGLELASILPTPEPMTAEPSTISSFSTSLTSLVNPMWKTWHQQLFMEQYEVKDVGLAQFVELCRRPELSDLTYGFLDDGVSGGCLVSYNRGTQAVKIHGPKDSADYAKLKITEFLNSMSPQFSSISCWQSQPAIKHPILADQQPDSHAFDCQYSKGPNRVFALRVDDDEGAITLWKEKVLPHLPHILSEQLGKNYSASLVRLGSKEEQTSLYILIQTDSRRSQSDKKAIRDKILRQFQSNRNISVKIKFKIGAMKLTFEDSKSDDGDEDNCGHRFYLSKRYWNRPGPGASIGPQHSESLSATMGGWLMVGGDLFFSTVLHVILESERQTQSNSGTSIMSPSRSDVKHVFEDLKVSLSDAQDMVERALPYESASDLIPSQVLALADSQVMAEYNHISSLLKELDKPEQEFELGPIKHRSDKASTQLELHNGSGSQDVRRRMDWCLGSPKDNRKGSNHYRHPSHDPSAFFGLSHTDSLGQGPFINEVCDVQPGARVYYVGRKSGRRSGVVHQVEQVYDYMGLSTNEWTMIADDDLNAGMVAGDSGAWIIRECDNKVMGHLWGFDRVGRFLLFTPMKDLFDDIRRKTGLQEVSLPGSGSRRLGLISGKSKTDRKARGFGFFNKKRETLELIPEPNLLPGHAMPQKIIGDAETTLRKCKTEPILFNLSQQQTRQYVLTVLKPGSATRKAMTFPVTKKTIWDISNEVHSPRITELISTQG